MTARVAIARTLEKHRSPDRVLALVRETLQLLGGMSQFVKPGQTVLIKPNQTVFYSAEEGCTTDPLVVAALIRLAKGAGAARVQVAESSGGFFSSMECMRITGMAAVAEREGAELIDLGSDDVPNRPVAIPEGIVIREAPIPAPLLDAHVIIDVPKAKNHHIEPISGALKNWVGAVNQSWRNRHHGDEDMIGRFMDIMTVTRPHLCVVDALTAGEGDGPIANVPRWCGCILASTDPVATDVAIAQLLGHDWHDLQFAAEAEKRRLGVRQPVEYLGVPMEEVAFAAWPGHQGYDYLPINFLVGRGVTLAGTIGHVKSAVDSMLRRGELNQVIWLRGTPTIMLGEVEDSRFEQHVKEGPYVVFDDAALPKYKDDRRVYFVPGHPVLQTALPELMKGLGVRFPGQSAMRWQQFERWGMHNIAYGSPTRRMLTIAKPLGAIALVAGGIAIVAALLNRRERAADIGFRRRQIEERECR
ncbi:MAG TPA: DUF362 domain-containing protein [Terriglobales bacterium]|nr:DUF362 domain-containing protein [Terriglobales bacterium]